MTDKGSKLGKRHEQQGKPGLVQAADAINDVVEDVTLKVAGVDPDAEDAAGRTNEQLYLPDSSVSKPLPNHIDPRSADREARERQRYIEEIVTAAASPSTAGSNQPKSVRRKGKNRK